MLGARFTRSAARLIGTFTGNIRNSSWRWLSLQVFMLMGLLGVFTLSAIQVRHYDADVTRTSLRIGGAIPVPALRFSPTHAPLDVVAVVAHGYSADKELMSALSVDLAKQGITTFAFDFPGHGSSTVPYGTASGTGVVDQLVSTVGEVVTFARAHAATPHPKVVLLGYSLGTIAVGEYVLRNPGATDIAATVLIAGILQDHPTISTPRNLLVLSGQFDLPGINETSRMLVASGCAVPLQAVTATYRCDTGLAQAHRQRIILPGLDHISIVTAGATHAAVMAWLGAYVDAHIGTVAANADVRLHWMLLGFLAAALALFPLIAIGSRLLNRRAARRDPRPVSASPVSVSISSPPPVWLDLAVLSGALIGGLLVLRMLLPQSFWAPTPLHFLAQQVSADTATYLAIVGALLLAGQALIPSLRARLLASVRASALWQIPLAAVGVLFLYTTLGGLSSFAWENLMLSPERLWRAAVYVALIAPYFVSLQAMLSGYMARRARVAALAQMVPAVLLIVALVAAIVMNFGRLSYLGILLPIVIIILLALVGLAAGVRRYLSAPTLLIATIQTLLLAWILAATLPLVG